MHVNVMRYEDAYMKHGYCRVCLACMMEKQGNGAVFKGLPKAFLVQESEGKRKTHFFFFILVC